MVPPVPEAPWNPSTWSPEVVWHRVLGPLATVWGWWLGYAVISVSLRMSGPRRECIQLAVHTLNLSPAFPLCAFARDVLGYRHRC